MNKDIRIAVGFFDHPKTVKLQRRCGYEGVISLQRLWGWAAQHRPSGDLSGLDQEDIEIAAKWVGDAGQFFQAITDLRFLDQEDDSITLHDWAENNSWVASSDERADRGRLNRMKTTHPEVHKLWVENRVGISKEEYSLILSAKDKLSTTQALLKQPLSTTQAALKHPSESCLSPRPKAQGPGPAPAPAPSPSPSLEPPPPDVNVESSEPEPKGGGGGEEALAEVKALYAETFRDHLPGKTVMDELRWMAEAFPLEELRDHFLAARTSNPGGKANFMYLKARLRNAMKGRRSPEETAGIDEFIREAVYDQP